MSREHDLLQRLHGVLGPAGPELTCEQCSSSSTATSS